MITSVPSSLICRIPEFEVSGITEVEGKELRFQAPQLEATKTPSLSGLNYRLHFREIFH